MIWRKLNPMPLNASRYEPAFEYMFIFSRGKNTRWNPKKERCKLAGKRVTGTNTTRTGERLPFLGHGGTYKDFKVVDNVWSTGVGSGAGREYKHPAVFPLVLASDHIRSWSNQFDTVFDPFMGSGTTGVACKNLAPYFIGIELDAGYYEIAKDRIENA